MATLRDLARGADSRWRVQLSAQPPKARIGKEAFKLTVRSAQSGYLTLLYVGSDGQEFMQLFPETPGQAVRVTANVPFRLPDEYAAHGPVGVNHVLAIVSATPRDFGSVLGKTGAARATLAVASALQDDNRNLRKRPQQGAAPELYGADLIELVEEK